MRNCGEILFKFILQLKLMFCVILAKNEIYANFIKGLKKYVTEGKAGGGEGEISGRRGRVNNL